MVISKELTRIAQNLKTADVQDVIDRIEDKVFNRDLRDEMIDRVTEFSETHNPNADLTPYQVGILFPKDELGDEFDIPKTNRSLEVDWSSHANYRSMLRDINSGNLNQALEDIAEQKPNAHDRRRFKMQRPSFGTAVVDFDTTRTDEEADVITVWK